MISGIVFRSFVAGLSVFMLFLACIGLRERGFEVLSDELDGRRFDTLDPKVKEYLRKLADAWKSHNESYILAQGEERYEAGVRPFVSKGTYLAMLYRVGPYARANRWSSASFELSMNAVKRIQFTGYYIEGPVLVIEARFEMATGESLPATLCVLWRLLDIKLIGALE